MSIVLRLGKGSAQNRAHPLDTRIRHAVRRCIEDEILRLIDIMDGLDVDADLEPSLGALEFGGQDRLYLGTVGGYPAWASNPVGDQKNWARTRNDEREEENEHDGDIQDQPHDPEPDEPSLGWTTTMAIGNAQDLEEDEPCAS